MAASANDTYSKILSKYKVKDKKKAEELQRFYEAAPGYFEGGASGTAQTAPKIPKTPAASSTKAEQKKSEAEQRKKQADEARFRQDAPEYFDNSETLRRREAEERRFRQDAPWYFEEQEDPFEAMFPGGSDFFKNATEILWHDPELPEPSYYSKIKAQLEQPPEKILSYDNIFSTLDNDQKNSSGFIDYGLYSVAETEAILSEFEIYENQYQYYASKGALSLSDKNEIDGLRKELQQYLKENGDPNSLTYQLAYNYAEIFSALSQTGSYSGETDMMVVPGTWSDNDDEADKSGLRYPIPWYFDTSIDSGQGSDNIEESYLDRTLNQILFGNYSDDVTALGTAGQVGLGLLGVDLPLDVRDLTYDLTHWDWSGKHIAQTLLDAIGLIPGVGILKNMDEVAAIIKNAAKNSDEMAALIRGVCKSSDEAAALIGTIANNSDEALDLIDGVAKNADEAEEILEGVLKNADEAADAAQSSGKAAANVIEGAEGKIFGNVDDVYYGQSSLDKAFRKHSADFGVYPDGSNISKELYKSDINYLLQTGIQRSGTYRATPGTHVFNPSTRQWAFYDINGNFVTAFRLGPDQFRYLIATGVVK